MFCHIVAMFFIITDKNSFVWLIAFRGDGIDLYCVLVLYTGMCM